MPFTSPIAATGCSGYCQRCRTHHVLHQGSSIGPALALQIELEKKGRIDLQAAAHQANPLCRLDYLFGPALGQMFGVMEFRAPDNSRGVVRAFSGQYNGRWQVEGWAPPLFAEEVWQQTNQDKERQIKELSRTIAQLGADIPHRQELIKARRLLSQGLMKELHAIYRLTNFRGETKSLPEVFASQGGIPTGTGDCCAPKLLNYAARHALTPLGISEFYLGRPNPSRTRQHGHFYSACPGKCQPILGFLLCGLEQ